MSNFGMAVGAAAEIAGVEKTMITSIKNLMESMNWTAQQAMDALKIPKDEQEKYEAKL